MVKHIRVVHVYTEKLVKCSIVESKNVDCVTGPIVRKVLVINI